MSKGIHMSNKIIITEADIITPAFCGDNAAAALSSWAMLVSSLLSLDYLDDQNKTTILCALATLCQTKMTPEPINVPPPVTTASYASDVVPTPVPNNSEIEINYSEQKVPKKENPMLKRMRELAGIPHAENRV